MHKCYTMLVRRRRKLIRPKTCERFHTVTKVHTTQHERRLKTYLRTGNPNRLNYRTIWTQKYIYWDKQQTQAQNSTQAPHKHQTNTEYKTKIKYNIQLKRRWYTRTPNTRKQVNTKASSWFTPLNPQTPSWYDRNADSGRVILEQILNAIHLSIRY